MYSREELILAAAERLGFDVSKLSTSTDHKMIACRHNSHGTKSPCCSISITRNMVHCFSCGYSGKLTSLFYEEFGHSISRELGLEPEKQINFGTPFTKKVEIDYNQVPEVNFTFTGTLTDIKNHSPVVNYLQKRGVTETVAEQMGMKYAVRAFSKLKTDPKDVIYFTGRLITPIYEGNLLSIEGRDILGEKVYIKKMQQLGKEPVGYRKVIYPKGASTSTLFQLKKLKTNEPVYLTEGLMDLAILRSDPIFKNSTTIFGAQMTQRQMFLLKPLDLIYCINNDEAGWLSVSKLFKYRGPFKILIPPRGAKDIGEIVSELDSTVSNKLEQGWFRKIHVVSEQEIQTNLKQYDRRSNVSNTSNQS